MGSPGSSAAVNPVSQAYTGINGYKYYEYMIANSTSVTISGTTPPVSIDELRLFPVGALMTTYTYKPMVGITSVTDPSNTTTYYEYDNLSRLIVLRDSKRKVLKTYKYHYKTAP